ncbi:carbohydrate ABC transporter permease [Glaciimonas immobilis]|uniref:sn-glycerol-3-phosphate transport system permease protein UgpE n=1 Tax=Glaciimonas immobilis TaxID=728004 RepID=A0A840RND5_9BURK|nr:carbohydrate ABC transporter permease [Glaciimonas immobilis]KAF3999156.1 carbohydrate ABC transporter permease [Glaciimonas immobilis]MBB5198602.1 multiple sugar transport system permease protein [Glaciimonas immobilis]
MKLNVNSKPGAGRWTHYGMLTMLAIFFFIPLLFMFVSALKTDETQLLSDMSGILAFVPYGKISLDNFRDVLARTDYLHAFINTLMIVSSTVVMGVLVNSMLAYALARFRFFGREFLLALVVALIIIPFEAIAVPLLLLVNNLPWFGGADGWLDSYQVQIIPFIAHAFSIYLFYQFFIALPKDLEEAALMDGAGRFRIYWSIVLPLSKPVIATVAILQFLARWGDLLWPVMVVRGDKFATLPLAMQTFFGQFPRHWGDVMAFAVMATLPTLLVFIVFQRWFVQSTISSGIKG